MTYTTTVCYDVYPCRLIINLSTGETDGVYDFALFSGSTLWRRLL